MTFWVGVTTLVLALLGIAVTVFKGIWDSRGDLW